jgi:hypothetical protein
MKSSTKRKATAPQSEARVQLGELIAARAELVAKVECLHAAAQKLESQKGGSAPLESQLAALDASESSAVSKWAQAGATGSPPKPDGAKRTRLDRALVEARAAANAATAAQASILAEHAAVSQQIASIQTPIEISIAAIVSEECTPLIAEFDADNRALAAKAVRLRQAHEMVLATLDRVRGTEPGRAVAFNLEELHGRLKRLFTAPPQDDDAASQSRLAWRAFADGLRTDANLKAWTKAGKKAKPEPVADIAAIAAKRLAAIAAKGL